MRKTFALAGVGSLLALLAVLAAPVAGEGVSAAAASECKSCSWDDRAGRWSCKASPSGAYENCNDNGGLLCQYSGMCIDARAAKIGLDGSVVDDHGGRSLVGTNSGGSESLTIDCNGNVTSRSYSAEEVAEHRLTTTVLTL